MTTFIKPAKTMQLDYIEEETLRQFIKNKEVEEADIQEVIYQQMQSKIIAILEERPHTGFASALTEAYQSYGIFGFQDIKTELHTKSYRTYTAENWANFMTYFNSKKVILTLISVASLYFLFKEWSYVQVMKYYGWAFMGIGVGVALYLAYLHYKTDKKMSFQNRWFSLYFVNFYLNIYLLDIFAREFFEKNIYLSTAIFTFGIIYSVSSLEFYLRKFYKQV